MILNYRRDKVIGFIQEDFRILIPTLFIHVFVSNFREHGLKFEQELRNPSNILVHDLPTLTSTRINIADESKCLVDDERRFINSCIKWNFSTPVMCSMVLST